MQDNSYAKKKLPLFKQKVIFIFQYKTIYVSKLESMAWVY